MARRQSGTVVFSRSRRATASFAGAVLGIPDNACSFKPAARNAARTSRSACSSALSNFPAIHSDVAEAVADINNYKLGDPFTNEEEVKLLAASPVGSAVPS